MSGHQDSCFLYLQNTTPGRMELATGVASRAHIAHPKEVSTQCINHLLILWNRYVWHESHCSQDLFWS